MPSITPFLWYDSQAEDAMNLYASIFPNAKVGNVSRAGDRVMSVEFELEGQRFMALNGGPMYKFNESVSFFVSCETQQEIDHYWSKLTANGGEPGRCGWLKDKYGLSWQIVPKAFSKLLGGGDPAATQRVVQAFMQMGKLDIQTLQDAHDGK